MSLRDLVIIGAGPAGLTAAIYGVRAGLDVLLIEKFSPGGQVVNTWEVENYPGFAEPVAGWELMSKMDEQAKRVGAEIISAEVSSIDRIDPENKFKLLLTDGKTVESKSVIIASGASFKRLGVPGEIEFTGRGVSYCATCDGAFYKGKVTAVVGGGNTALEEAIFLTRFAEKVYIVHRRTEFRGSMILQERVKSNSKIEIVYDSVVESINGSVKVDSVTIKNIKTSAQSTLGVDGIFIFVGFDPATGYLPAEILNENREVAVDMRMRTKIRGLFAAGDLRAMSKRQIVMACADGATAAMEAYDYIFNNGQN